MITVQFLAEWALRSSILILTGWLLLRALRVKDPSIRLAAWMAMLGGSLAIPALTAVLPSLQLAIPRFETVRPEVVRLTPPVSAPPVEVPRAAVYEAAPAAIPVVPRTGDRVLTRFGWELSVIAVYLLVAGALLLRLFTGLAISLRLLRDSRATGHATEGIAIRESDRVAAPVTLGIVRPAILLPVNWREWDSLKLNAVLAHERSHVRRRDPAVQLLSVIHRTLLWYSPLSWFLHKRIVRAAEDASDDAAVAATHDRASYAEVLLDFMRRGTSRASWRRADCDGVAMARYGLPEERIQRILDATTLSRGVTRWSVAAILSFGSPLAYFVATAQPQNVAQLQLPTPPAPRAPAPQAFQASRSAVSGPTFDTADIRSSGPNTIPRMRNGFSRGRYQFGNATMVDLIRTAWSVDADRVVGGPDWLDTERFDVVATAPVDSTPDTLKTMLRAMLRDRFQLTLHTGTKDLPAYAMTADKKVQLKQSDGDEETGCKLAGRKMPGDPFAFTCRNMTMAAFADGIPGMAGAPGYLFNYRVIDQTRLKGAWDFSVKWSPDAAGLPIPAAAEKISLFDAFEKQLGLKLRLTKVPMPVVMVDGARKPVTEKPPAPRLEFEVATIKPDEPGGRGGNVGIQPGGHVRIVMTLKDLMWEAWGNLNTERIVLGPNSGGPKSLDGTVWVIEAKAAAQQDAPAGWNGPVWNGVDLNSMRMMLRALLVDRFKLEAHLEDRPVSGYALVALKGASKTKLTPADPSNRPGCKGGPGADGKDPRLANPVAYRLVTCRNMTLAQFAAELSKPTTEENPILGNFPPVVDATGIDGRYDMTINFTPPSAIQNAGGPTAGGNAVGSEPDGTISIFEALDKQLGLKLESRKVMGQVLVIDHVEEKPTDN